MPEQNATTPSDEEGSPLPRRKLHEAENETLDGFISRFETSLSWALHNTLTIAAEEAAAAGHSGRVPWIDCQTLFLAFLTLGFEEREAAHAVNSLPLDLVQSLGYNEAGVNRAKHWYRKETDENPPPWGEIPNSIFGWDEQFDRLWRTAVKIKHACSPRTRYLAARHLLAAFIQIAVERKDAKLEIVGLEVPVALEALAKNCSVYERKDSRGNWSRFFARYGSASFKNGQNQDFNREADERQAALKVDDYASAFARFFNSAGSEECCLAVFAPWGRGKSFLMKRLKAMLEPFSYDTVSFQAWKYPTRPEVWVHLYETMCRAAFGGPWWQKWPRVFRTGLARRGSLPLILPLLGLAFATMPKLHLAFQAMAWGSTFLTGLGIGSLIWLVVFFLSARKSAEKIAKDYLMVPRHGEKLGLQATIGDDLASLLEGWMPSSRRPGLFLALGYTLVIGMAFRGASEWGHFSLWGLIPGQWGIGSLLPWVVSGLLLLAGGWMFSWFGEPRRILLVVDDLDRCSQDHLISVMESVKLLIEDKKVGRRLQLAMLVEEEVLKHAILHKYAAVRGPVGAPVGIAAGMSDGRIVRESFEKLFTVHLRLDPLTADEAEELLARMFRASNPDPLNAGDDYAENEEEEEEEDHPSRPNATRGMKPGGETNSKTSDPGTETNGQKLPAKPTGQETKVPQKSTLARQLLPCFSMVEEGILIAAVRDLVDARGDDVVGPRSVRNFAFRYQLARLLLDQLKVKFEPDALAQALVKAMTNAPVDAGLNQKILRVVRQVS